MSGTVFDEGNVNTAALTVPGAYTQIMADNTGNATLNPSNVIALVGAGKWGQVGKVMPWSSSGDAGLYYGQYDASLADPYDLMQRVLQAFQNAQTQASLTVLTVRITDGTDLAASVPLLDTTAMTPIHGIVLTGKYTGTGGNSIKVIVSNGAGTGLYNVTIIATFGGATNTEQYTNLPGVGAGVFWTNLANALTQGQANVRGPSQLVVPSAVSGSAIAPVVNTYTLTGGTDGRSGLTSSSFFGSDVIGNRQGIYALRGQKQLKPAYLGCCGLTDSSKAATLLSFSQQETVRVLFPFPIGTDTTTAVSDKQTNGIADKRFIYLKDWLFWADPVSGVQLLTDPMGLAIGRLGCLSPELSPLNKSVAGVAGSERTTEYPDDEIGLLHTNGILVIANPIEGGAQWGFLTGRSTSLNPNEAPIERSRLQDYIAQQGNGICGQFVGDKQGLTDPDDTRAACKGALDDMFQRLQRAKIIDQSGPGQPGFVTVCDAILNTTASIRARYMIANAWYRPYGGVDFVLVNLFASITDNAPFSS